MVEVVGEVVGAAVVIATGLSLLMAFSKICTLMSPCLTRFSIALSLAVYMQMVGRTTLIL